MKKARSDPGLFRKLAFMIRFVLTLFFFGLTEIVMAQHPGFTPIDDQTNLWGAWEAQDGEETYIQPIQDEDAPGGYILVLHGDMNYFSSWVDEEMGASVDLQFDYELEGNTLNCKMTMSNAIGYYMEHENQPFSFQLFISETGDSLLIELTNGETYILEKSK